MTSNAPETALASGMCARYLLFRPWLVSHKYVTLFQRSPVPLPHTRPSVAWCSTRWPTTPWSRTSATTATWSSGRVCGAVTGARSGQGSSQSAEVNPRLTVVTFVEQFHRILSNWNSELKVVTTGDNELVNEIWWGQLSRQDSELYNSLQT